MQQRERISRSDGMRPDAQTYSTPGPVGLKDQFRYSHPQWEVSNIQGPLIQENSGVKAGAGLAILVEVLDHSDKVVLGTFLARSGGTHRYHQH